MRHCGVDERRQRRLRRSLIVCHLMCTLSSAFMLRSTPKFLPRLEVRKSSSSSPLSFIRHNTCITCTLQQRPLLIFEQSNTIKASTRTFSLLHSSSSDESVEINDDINGDNDSDSKSDSIKNHIIKTTTSISSSNNDANDKASNDDNDNDDDNSNYQWTKKTASLALPALIGMLADPLLSLMDTAYVGRLGSARELAALGACTSIFHLAFNAFRATTSATTSLVGNANTEADRRQIVQISLTLGVVLGIVVMTFLQSFGPWCLSTMGISAGSPLFSPARAYLGTRSWAAPAVLIITVAEGAFRGYGDTKIPLLASLAASLINLVLDPLLMLPPLSRGVQGAAAATASSQAGAVLVYYYFLRKRRMLPKKQQATTTTTTTTATTTATASSTTMKTTTNGTTATSLSKKKVVMTILGANLAMICKQGSLLLAWAYATSRATRIGSAHVAAHQVGLSCWLVFALIQDGAGVAAQVLLTKVIKNGSSSSTYKKVRSLVLYMLRFSFLQGLATTGALLLASPYLPKLFVPCDVVVQGHLKSLLPHLAWQQILVSLTLVIESLAIGGSQFRLLAIGTTFSTVFAIAQLRQATTVVDIWSRGIVSLFAGRLVTALIGVACVLRRCRKERDEEIMTTVTPKQLDIEVYPKHFPG